MELGWGILGAGDISDHAIMSTSLQWVAKTTILCISIASIIDSRVVSLPPEIAPEEVKAAPTLSSSFPLMATDSPYFQYLLFLR